VELQVERAGGVGEGGLVEYLAGWELQRQLQDVKNRFEAGTVSNFEVLRAEVALANAQPAPASARIAPTAGSSRRWA